MIHDDDDVFDDFYILFAGIGKNGIYENFTNAFIMERASVPTLPFAIDDPSQKPTKGSDLSDIVVDHYNQGKVNLNLYWDKVSG